jgi:hypothetical protein
MMPPTFFTKVRMGAAHHLQARILDWNGRLSVRVIRVFRGGLKRGSRLSLSISVRPDCPTPFDSTIYVDRSVLESARFAEAFLDGDPPDVVRDQIKFLRGRPWGPTGDPSREVFIW